MSDAPLMAAIVAAIEEEENALKPKDKRRTIQRQPRRLVPSGDSPASVPPHYSASEIGNVDTSTVAVTFDRDITIADASGVTIKVNGSSATITSAARQTDHAIVYFVLASPASAGDTVTWEYSGGTIASEADGTPLETVSAQTVANNIVSGEDFMKATVTLTNDQIKALPTTQVTVIPGPGNGKGVLFVQAFLELVWTADYMNIDPDASINLNIGPGGSGVFGRLYEGGNGDVSLLLASGGLDNPIAFVPFFGSVHVSAAPSTPSINGFSGYYNTGLDNAALTISANNGLGDFTGGDPANSLKVTVIYDIIDL